MCRGQLETLRSTIGKIGNEEAKISIKHSAVGGINESDVNLRKQVEASSSDLT